jgi:hypothetical protein
MAKLVLGGPKHRTAIERFQSRMSTLIDLRDVELTIEERDGTVWYMALCADCDDVTPMPPFNTDQERLMWVLEHVEATSHTRVIKFEEPR